MPPWDQSRRGCLLYDQGRCRFRFLAPFFDFGHGWQTTVATPGTPPKTLASVGIGAIWNFWRGSHFEIYYGKQLKRYDTDRDNLQDHGIHLQWSWKRSNGGSIRDLRRLKLRTCLG